MDGDGWIEVNLPWCKHVELEKPEYPVELVDRLVRKRFGQTAEEFERAFEQKHGQSANEVSLTARINEVDKNSPLMKELETLDLMKDTIEEFERGIPEVVAWAAECDKITQQEREEEGRVSFHASELRRPGVMIEVQDNGSGVRRYLLGNINCNAGVCDDCVAFEQDAIVLRAKVLVAAAQLD